MSYDIYNCFLSPVSMFMFGTMFGNLLSGGFSNTFGCLWTLRGSCILLVVSAAIQFATDVVEPIVATRFMQGEYKTQLEFPWDIH